MELLTPILNDELLESATHLIQSEKYNIKIKAYICTYDKDMIQRYTTQHKIIHNIR